MANSPEYTKRHRKSHPLYDTWAEMKQRCLISSKENYPRYGGRGVTVCDRWLNSFAAFEEDMSPRPPGTTLDRIDNDGPYSPENCRWATLTEQARNRSTNRFLEFRGQRKTVIDWAEEVGISRKTICSRLDQHGWSVERALTTPPRALRSNRQEVLA